MRPAVAADWPACLRLLDQAGLPVDDIADFRPDDFLVVVAADAAIAGLIGLERFGSDALLRSLVVAPLHQGQGVAVELLDALTELAGTGGAETLWLLTIDADQWFARHGFKVASRQEAPDSIAHTREFAELCPDDAVLMRKDLRQ